MVQILGLYAISFPCASWRLAHPHLSSSMKHLRIMMEQAASVLCQHGLSTAIFAPAWPYEHFSTVISQGMERTIAKAVDRSMWEGVILPEELGCDCRKGRPHHTLFYRSNPIIGQFNELPSGSNQFFETHFNREINDVSPSRDEVCTALN